MLQSKSSSLPYSGTELAVCCAHKEEHALYLRCHYLVITSGSPTAQFELLNNITDLLKAMDVSVLSTNRVSNHQKCGPLKEQYFISVQDASEVTQA